MHSLVSPRSECRFRGCRILAAYLLSALAAAGCGQQEKSRYTSVSKPPAVKVIQPALRKIVRIVGQPSFVESYERTSIYPKLTGYIEKWNVDIGDKVRKGAVLGTLFVPELVEDFGTKKATVKLDEQKIELAKKMVEVADADVKAARAELEEARSILAKYQSEVDRWDTEVKRLKREVERGVVDPQILLESTNQLRSSVASKDAARATISKQEAELLSRQATLAKAKVDVEVAQADLSVAVSEMKRIEAWVGYITLPAPFDGVIVARNANTGDFVIPSSGDPTAMSRSPYLSPGGAAAPIYVVDRTDVVRIFVDIPEQDANYVRGCDVSTIFPAKPEDLPNHGKDLVVMAGVDHSLHFRIFNSEGKRVVDTDERGLKDKQAELARLRALLQADSGVPRLAPIDKERAVDILKAIFGKDQVPQGSKATVLVKAYRDAPISATVSRTSWALNVKSRTLRAEIDLPNPESQLLPGMYAYAKVIIERPDVRALPVSALTHGGENTYCWLYQDGHAARAEIQTGVSDGDWIEVTNLQPPGSAKANDPWVPIVGTEKVILGDLSILADGAKVEILTEKQEASDTGSAPSPVAPRDSGARDETALNQP